MKNLSEAGCNRYQNYFGKCCPKLFGNGVRFKLEQLSEVDQNL